MELYDAVSVVLVGHTQYQLTLLSLSHEMILFRKDTINKMEQKEM